MKFSFILIAFMALFLFCCISVSALDWDDYVTLTEDFEDDVHGSDPTEDWYVYDETGCDAISGASNTEAQEGSLSGFVDGTFLKYNFNDADAHNRVDFWFFINNSHTSNQISYTTDGTIVWRLLLQDEDEFAQFDQPPVEVDLSLKFDLDTWIYLRVDNHWDNTTFYYYIDNGTTTDEGWLDMYASPTTADTLTVWLGGGDIYIDNITLWTSELTFVNTAPSISGESPSDNAVDVSLTTPLYALCSDYDNDSLNATWYSNVSGHWVRYPTNWSIWQSFATNTTSFSNNTNITQTFTDAYLYNTTYYWSVNLSDGENWTNVTYSFTTEVMPVSTVFTATPNGYTQMELVWTSTHDLFIVERNNVTEWSQGEGTEIYNGSAFNYTDTGLTAGTTYYYQVWSYYTPRNPLSRQWDFNEDGVVDSDDVFDYWGNAGDDGWIRADCQPSTFAGDGFLIYEGNGLIELPDSSVFSSYSSLPSVNTTEYSDTYMDVSASTPAYLPSETVDSGGMAKLVIGIVSVLIALALGYYVVNNYVSKQHKTIKDMVDLIKMMFFMLVFLIVIVTLIAVF